MGEAVSQGRARRSDWIFEGDGPLLDCDEDAPCSEDFGQRRKAKDESVITFDGQSRISVGDP
jgi:hypothetical protein